MKKFGFTLSEVLVTVSIIGVISALTIPSLVNSSKSDVYASKLAVTVSNLENAFTSAIANQNAVDIYRTSMWNQLAERKTTDEAETLSDVTIDSGAKDSEIRKFIGQLNKYIVINGYEKITYDNTTTQQYNIYKDNKPHVMSASGTAGDAFPEASARTLGPVDFKNYLALKLKNGAVVMIQTFQLDAQKDWKEENASSIYTVDDDTALASGISLQSAAADIIIDVNGKDKPNLQGRDIFRFILGQNGILYPYGGYDAVLYKQLKGKNAVPASVNTWKSSDANNEDACNDGTPSRRGWGCTARLVENGYKFDY